MLFRYWTRETGVIPAGPAGLLVGMDAPGARLIASVTFIGILMTILIQAPTTKWLGSKLKTIGETIIAIRWSGILKLRSDTPGVPTPPDPPLGFERVRAAGINVSAPSV